jgi:signal-transduction protein with cAMP-binding, CBS, and nucleotidyltransferase domain
MGAADKHGNNSWTELQERDDARRLREFPAFEKFSEDDLNHLVRVAHHDSTSGPWPLIHEQTPADSCYILLSGDVGVYAGREHIASLGPGEVIGESALRMGKLRSATVTTTGPTEVLRIEAEDLTGLLRQIPALRAVIEASATRHTPVTAGDSPAPTGPRRVKVDASIPAELVERFEHTAGAAGLTIAAALEDALSRWIDSES